MQKLLESTRHLSQTRQALLDALHDASATESIIILQAIEQVMEPKNLIESLLNAMEADKC